jgi:hypothetical protein
MTFPAVAASHPSPAILGVLGVGLLIVGAPIFVFQKAVMQKMGRNWSISTFGAAPNPGLMRFFALLAGCMFILFGALVLGSALFPPAASKLLIVSADEPGAGLTA